MRAEVKEDCMSPDGLVVESADIRLPVVPEGVGVGAKELCGPPCGGRAKGFGVSPPADAFGANPFGCSAPFVPGAYCVCRA